MEPLQPLDRDLFEERGTDLPLNAADRVFQHFAEELESFDYFDRAVLMTLEVKVAMLWRLSSYFQNVVTTKEDAQRWKKTALKFFDSETRERGDAKEVAQWRQHIVSNFDRLIEVLLPED